MMHHGLKARAMQTPGRPQSSIERAASGQLIAASHETIASDLRKASSWFAIPLLAASLVRVVMEPHYLGVCFVAWIVCLALYMVGLRWLLHQPDTGRIRAALIANFSVINLSYALIGCTMNASPGWRADRILNAVDQTLFRRDPAVLFQNLNSPWISTLAVLGYSSFFVFFLYLFLAEAFVLSRWTGRLQMGLLRLYALGYSGYLLFPASGPLFGHQGALPAIVHSDVSASLNNWLVSCCLGVDAWPSLHAGVCIFTLIWTWHRYPRVALWFSAPAAGLMFGAVYLHYHYFFDMISGAALGAACAYSVLGLASEPVNEAADWRLSYQNPMDLKPGARVSVK